MKRLLIADFLGNISARNHQSSFMYVKVIASGRSLTSSGHSAYETPDTLCPRWSVVAHSEERKITHCDFEVVSSSDLSSLN